MDGTERLSMKYGWLLVDEEARWVAEVNVMTRTEATNRANARRFVALWNALRGVSTEALEAVAAQPTDGARMSALARVPFPAEFTPAPSD